MARNTAACKPATDITPPDVKSWKEMLFKLISRKNTRRNVRSKLPYWVKWCELFQGKYNNLRQWVRNGKPLRERGGNSVKGHSHFWCQRNYILLLPSSVDKKIRFVQLPIRTATGFFLAVGRSQHSERLNRTEVEGDRMMFPMEAFSSSMVARLWWVPLFGWTGLISTWNFLGSYSSSESLDE